MIKQNFIFIINLVIMEEFQIKCDKCNIEKSDIFTIEYDDNVIKSIIDSNYIIHIRLCEHNEDSLKNLFTDHYHHKLKMSQLAKTILCRIQNNNYLKIYKEFRISEISVDSSIKLKISCNENEITKIYTTDEFINTIKRGTIISLFTSKISEIEKNINSVGFILKTIKKNGYTCHIIDASTSTKPAINQSIINRNKK